MPQAAQRLLLTTEGRRVLVAAYVVGAVASVVTYWFARGPAYAVGQVVLFTFGLFWARWCLRRR